MQDANTCHSPEWRYVAIDGDHDDDVKKTEHFAKNTQTGQRVNLDFTPYRHMHPVTFQKLVEMGFPPRPGMGPWSPEDVEKAYEAWRRRKAIRPVVQAVKAVAAVAVCAVLFTALADAIRGLADMATSHIEWTRYERLH